jgi:N-acetyl-anhydromuramyl-L-alanine amidase AmpD
VIHFVSNTLENPESPYVLEDIRNIFIDYETSSHYLIDREGEIHQLVPESLVAFHAGSVGSLPEFPEYENKLNDYSIGIELMGIGTENEMSTMVSTDVYNSISPGHIGFTDQQYQALNVLTDDILTRNTLIKKDRNHIIGHSEYAPDRKTDPGVLFDWSKLGL